MNAIFHRLYIFIVYIYQAAVVDAWATQSAAYLLYKIYRDEGASSCKHQIKLFSMFALATQQPAACCLPNLLPYIERLPHLAGTK